jgi:photosystem II stability/assembly factor-like uncharacterized protein
MRLMLRGLLVVAVSAAVVAQAGAAPARLVTRAVSAVFWTPQQGLVAVRYCTPGSSHCGRGAVARTTDGGRTYRVILRTRHPITDVERMGPHGAVITPLFSDALRTVDGGRTWRPFTFEPWFWATPRIAFRIDRYYARDTPLLALRVTHDGGRTWRRLADPCNQTVADNAYADLVTPKLWWMVCVGRPAGGTMDKAVFRTRDGGKTWQPGAADLSSLRRGAHGGIGSFGYPVGVAFAPNGFGLLIEGSGKVYVTRDGGSNFHVAPGVERPDIDYARSAAVFSNGVAYVLLTAGFPARLVATHDFGRTWHVVRRWRG